MLFCKLNLFQKIRKRGMELTGRLLAWHEILKKGRERQRQTEINSDRGKQEKQDIRKKEERKLKLLS